MRTVPLFFLIVFFFCSLNAQSSTFSVEKSFQTADTISHQESLGFDDFYLYEALEEDNRYESSSEEGFNSAFKPQGDNYLKFKIGSKDYPLLTTVLSSEFHLRGPPNTSSLF